MFKKNTFIINIFLLVALCVPAYVQLHTIQLENIKSGRKIKPIPIGARVVYSILDSGMNRVSKGHLQSVDSIFIVINGNTISLRNLTGISRKRKGTGFASFILLGFGSQILIGGALFSGTDNPGETLPAAVLGTGLIVWGGNVIGKNSLRKT